MKLIAESTLVECLDLLDAGESLEAVLAHFPETAEALRPFLVTAVHLSQLAAQPALAAKQESQQRFLQRAAELRAAAAAPYPWSGFRQALMPLVSLAVVLLIVGVTFITASATAVPGDPLYGAKRFWEEVRLTRIGRSGDVETLTEQIQAERIREVEAVLRTDRDVSLTFEGPVNVIQAGSWLIAGIEVRIDQFTRIEGQPVIGSWVQANGRTHNGIFRATSIIVLSGGAPPTETPGSPQPADTPRPLPTSEPSTPPPSTETPLPGSDNGDDNTNDNSGDDSANDNDSSGSGSGNENDNENDNGSSNSGNGNENDNNNDNEGRGSGGSNDNSNDNDNSGTGSGNDNNNSNDNDSNGTGSGNDNDNGNDNGNDSSGSGSGNDNSNGNDNDSSGSGSGNDNDNGNDNDSSGSGGGSDNGNDNGDDNDNDNSGNDNANDNSDDNANDNSDNDENSGSGSDSSGHGNSGDDNSGSGSGSSGSGSAATTIPGTAAATLARTAMAIPDMAVTILDTVAAGTMIEHPSKSV